MPEPRTVGFSGLTRIMAGIRARGLDGAPGPVDDAPDPDEPGHPEYHRRQRAKVAVARWNTAVPYRYRDATAEHPEIVAWADRAARDIHAAGFLVINGNLGTGKTHQAFGALRRVAEAGPKHFQMLFAPAPDLYGKVRPGGSDKGSETELRRYARIPFLLIDDLGTEKPSVHTEEVTYRIVNERYNACLPLIITSNFPVRSEKNDGTPDLAGRLGDRLASRLAHDGHVVTLTGPDRRRSTK